MRSFGAASQAVEVGVEVTRTAGAALGTQCPRVIVFRHTKMFTYGMTYVDAMKLCRRYRCYCLLSETSRLKCLCVCLTDFCATQRCLERNSTSDIYVDVPISFDSILFELEVA